VAFLSSSSRLSFLILYLSDYSTRNSFIATMNAVHQGFPILFLSGLGREEREGGARMQRVSDIVGLSLWALHIMAGKGTMAGKCKIVNSEGELPDGGDSVDSVAKISLW
jgi:hypothetical protein